MSNTPFTSADIGFSNDRATISESTDPINIDCTGLRTSGSCAFLVTARSNNNGRRLYAIIHLPPGNSRYIVMFENVLGTISMTGGILSFTNSAGSTYTITCMAIC
jgi:hypothetical protein